MPKNVPFTIFCMPKALFSLLLVTGLLLPLQASAQMFSVQSQPDRITIPESGVSAGISFVDFRYRGPDGLLAANEDYSFSAPLAHVRLDLAAFSVYGIYGRGIGPRDNVFSELGASINSGFVVLPGTSLNLIIPLSLSTEYVLVRNQRIINNTDEFRQNNFGLKSGLQMNAQLSQRSRFMVEGTGSYAFSITGYGLSSGSATGLELTNRLYFDRIFGQVGILLGFDIETRRYRLEEDRFNYRSVYQNVVLGITF